MRELCLDLSLGGVSEEFASTRLKERTQSGWREADRFDIGGTRRMGRSPGDKAVVNTVCALRHIHFEGLGSLEPVLSRHGFRGVVRAVFDDWHEGLER